MANGTITGRLGNLELKTSASGTTYINVGIAYTPRSRNEQGEWVDGETVWYNCTAFGKTAERMSALGKGTPVVVTGRFQPRTWTAQDGTKRNTMSFIVDNGGVSVPDWYFIARMKASAPEVAPAEQEEAVF